MAVVQEAREEASRARYFARHRIITLLKVADDRGSSPTGESGGYELSEQLRFQSNCALPRIYPHIRARENFEFVDETHHVHDAVAHG